MHLINPALLSLPSAITLGAIAAATAPAATLMVVRQYKADGPLTKLLLMVVAIDDAVGLVLFSVSFGIAGALEMGSISVVSVILEPIIEIVISLVLGALSGLALNWLETYFHSRSKRLSLTVAFVLLMVGISSMEFELGGVKIGFSLLLVCMMTGTVFCNVCSASEELMSRLDRWTGPINILFFVLSGAELDLNILSNPLVLLIGIIYIVFRSLGKISGSYISCAMTKCSDHIKKHLASRFCRRPAWRSAWRSPLHLLRTAASCATSCCSPCWCMSLSARLSQSVPCLPQAKSSPRQDQRPRGEQTCKAHYPQVIS